jgi:hypothetical protein
MLLYINHVCIQCRKIMSLKVMRCASEIRPYGLSCRLILPSTGKRNRHAGSIHHISLGAPGLTSYSQMDGPVRSHTLNGLMDHCQVDSMDQPRRPFGTFSSSLVGSYGLHQILSGKLISNCSIQVTFTERHGQKFSDWSSADTICSWGRSDWYQIKAKEES